MSETANFEVNTWADAEVEIGPGNPAHPDHATWLAEQDQDDEQADEESTARPESSSSA